MMVKFTTNNHKSVLQQPSLHNLDKNGTIIPSELQESFITDHFSNIAKQIGVSYEDETALAIIEFITKISNLAVSQPRLIDKELTMGDLLTALTQINTHKAPGPDGIPALLLTVLPPLCLQFLLDSYNSCLHSSTMPIELLQGIIVPILKIGKPSYLCDSFRPITLLNSMSKLLERMLLVKLEPIILPHIHPEQLGFQRGRGWRDALFCLSESITQSLDRGSPVFSAFLDVRKAFDSVWHSGLFERLHHYGVRGPIWDLLFHWYSSYNLKVQLSLDSCSKPFHPKTGTIQGGHLSPLLYLAFVNQIITELNS
eukprot:Lithocolla_globosa_v1_NODE_2008_length_2211_cov_7.663265.p1 type:complete len:312 gc:universal NODE_2008_length_2211_cov_7.663265:701-1636(+)